LPAAGAGQEAECGAAVEDQGQVEAGQHVDDLVWLQPAQRRRLAELVEYQHHGGQRQARTHQAKRRASPAPATLSTHRPHRSG
jgi:hypothetical protein